jgi:hypothetical protein
MLFQFMRYPCTLLTEEDLCPLHDQGLKPIEGRLTMGCEKDTTKGSLHEAVAMTWDNPKAQTMVREWQEKTNDTHTTASTP